MSRAHLVAPMLGAEASLSEPLQEARPLVPRLANRTMLPSGTCYLERAMLLWPRLDRAKIRRVSDNPVRIAEIVERRTSQPFDAILAMLTKRSPALAAAPEEPTSFEPDRPETARFVLRIVRSEAGGDIRVQDLPPD